MKSITFKTSVTGSTGFEHAMAGNGTIIETVYEDGRIVRADDGSVRTYGFLDIEVVRKARIARGWVVIAESP